MTWSGVQPFPNFADDEPILGLTFQQPYASAIIDGPKRVENRSWMPPARLRGSAFWIAVHAGTGWYEGAERSIAVWRANVPPYTDAEPHLNAWLEAPPHRASYPSRTILGLARVVGCFDLAAEEGIATGGGRFAARARATLDAHRAWAFGPFCWELDPVVVRFREPYAWDKGMLGLWELPPPSLTSLRALRNLARTDPTLTRRA
jgi:hypothetical protein